MRLMRRGLWSLVLSIAPGSPSRKSVVKSWSRSLTRKVYSLSRLAVKPPKKIVVRLRMLCLRHRSSRTQLLMPCKERLFRKGKSVVLPNRDKKLKLSLPRKRRQR